MSVTATACNAAHLISYTNVFVDQSCELNSILLVNFSILCAILGLNLILVLTAAAREGKVNCTWKDLDLNHFLFS